MDNDSERLLKQTNSFTGETRENDVSSIDSLHEATEYAHPNVTERKGHTNLLRNRETNEPYVPVRDAGTQFNERHRVEERRGDIENRWRSNHEGASRSVETTMTARRVSGKPAIPHTWGRENATPTRSTELASATRSMVSKESANKTGAVHDGKMTHDRVYEPNSESTGLPPQAETKPSANLSPTEEYLRMTERCIAEEALPPDCLKTLRDVYARYKTNKGCGTATDSPRDVTIQRDYARSIDHEDPLVALETEDALGMIGYSFQTDNSLLAGSVEKPDGDREVSYRAASVGYDELESSERNSRASRGTAYEGMYGGTNAAEEVRFNTGGPAGRKFNDGGTAVSELSTTRKAIRQNSEEEFLENGLSFWDFEYTFDFETLAIESIFSDFSLRGRSYDEVLKKRISAKAEAGETQRFGGSENIHGSSTSTAITGEISGKREIRFNDDARPYKNQETSPRKSENNISRGMTVRSNRQCKCQKDDLK